jgi:hypothetical protein
MGKLNLPWLDEVHQSLTGGGRHPSDAPEDGRGFPNMHIQWPTEEVVFESNQHFLDSLNMQADFWNGEGFPRHMFYEVGAPVFTYHHG